MSRFALRSQFDRAVRKGDILNRGKFAILAVALGSLLGVWLLAGAVPAAFAAEGGHAGGSSSHDSGGHDEGEGDSDAAGHTGGHAGGRGKGQGGTHGAGGHGGAASSDIGAPGGRSVESRVLRGGRPVWAGPEFPEVEIGRLNVSRAPSRVLDHARVLVMEDLPSDLDQLYALTAEEAAAWLSTDYENVPRIHSPLQNLALYRDVMTFGSVDFLDVQPASQLDLAAMFLASAADRGIPIENDTVVALNMILGLIDMEPTDLATLATKAETIRQGMAIGHGPEGEHGEAPGMEGSSGETSEHGH